MNKAKFLNTIEMILESKQRSFLKGLLEGKKRISEEDATGDECNDALTAGAENPDVNGGSSGGGAGSTDASRQADGADSAQADISHLEEEDDAESDILHLMTGQRDGEDVVKTESEEDEDYEELEESEEDEDYEELEESEEDEDLDSFFENAEEWTDDEEGAELTEARKTGGKKKPMVGKRRAPGKKR